jgi:predicted DNA-binding protein
MAVSVRMDPRLEQELQQAASLRGITKSQFIVDAVERALGRKDPYQLLLQVQDEMKLELRVEQRARRKSTPAPQLPLSTGDKVRAVLQKKRAEPAVPAGAAKAPRRAAA